jgi:hypothetical protein
VTKKLTRSRRKELRTKGQLKPAANLSEVQAQKAAERKADEEAVSARVHEAREQIAHRHDEGEDEAAAPAKKPRRQDFTVLLLVGLTALAGLLYWLSQRPPSKAEPTAATTTAATAAPERTPLTVTAPLRAPLPPLQPAQPPPPPAALPAPAPQPAPPVNAAPSASAAPSTPPLPSPPPKRVEPARPQPPKAQPKKPEGDPYG